MQWDRFILSIMMNTQWMCMEVVRVVGVLVGEGCWDAPVLFIPLRKMLWSDPSWCWVWPESMCTTEVHQSVRCSRVWSGHRARPGTRTCSPQIQGTSTLGVTEIAVQLLSHI